MPLVESPKRKSSKCHLVANHVRGQITSGRLRGGDRVSTVAELRIKFEASTAAVDRALFLLSQEGLIVREHGRGIFVASQELKTTGLLGYVMSDYPEGESSYSMHMIRGLQRVAHSRGFEMLLINPFGADAGSRIDGLVVHGDHLFDLGKPATSELPVVSVMLPSQHGPCVIADDFQGVQNLTNHLIGLGHRRIATLMWSEMRLTWYGRIGPYRATLMAAGIDPDPRWSRDMHFMHNGPYTTQSEIAYYNMSEWLRDNWCDLGCTAVISQNDRCAEGVIRAVRDFGLDVPGDLSVTGYDATEDRAPEITSVRVPIELIASKAAEMLLERMAGTESSVSSVMLRTELVPARSTAPPRLMD